MGIAMSRIVKSPMRDGGMWGASAGRDKERDIGRGAIAQGEAKIKRADRTLSPWKQEAQRPQICRQHTKGLTKVKRLYSGNERGGEEKWWWQALVAADEGSLIMVACQGSRSQMACPGRCEGAGGGWWPL